MNDLGQRLRVKLDKLEPSPPAGGGGGDGGGGNGGGGNGGGAAGVPELIAAKLENVALLSEASSNAVAA